MTVLVTGATGLLGSHLVDLLVERGEPVRALIRPGENASRLAHSGVTIYWGDMADRASMEGAIQGIECILHCAARTGPWGPEAEYRAINVRGLKWLVEAALAAGVRRFVHG
jgi:nucleoside-diphosphate-sugar epimerase